MSSPRSPQRRRPEAAAGLSDSPEVVDLCGPSLLSPEKTAVECPICLGPVHLSGDHSLVATLCGHLFGRSCLAQALSLRGECPKCRSSARALRKRKRVEFIALYDTNVTVVDAEAEQQLEKRLAVSQADLQQVLISKFRCCTS